jgi:hypothetical protein
MTDKSVNWPNTCYGAIPQQTLHSLPLQNPFLSAPPPITGHQFLGLQGKRVGSMHRDHNQPCLPLHCYRKLLKWAPREGWSWWGVVAASCVNGEVVNERLKSVSHFQSFSLGVKAEMREIESLKKWNWKGRAATRFSIH